MNKNNCQNELVNWSRREFVKATGLGVLGAGLSPAAEAGTQPVGGTNAASSESPTAEPQSGTSSKKLKLGVLVTLEDHAAAFGTFHKCGVYHILYRLHSSGITRLYLRSLGDGMARYPSRLTSSRYYIAYNEYAVPVEYADGPLQFGWLTPERIQTINASWDYGSFDHFACARQRTRELGMDMIVWHEVRGEDHSSGVASEFVKKYPQFLSVNRRGEHSPTELSWAFPEVLERRLGLYREVIGYEPDEVWFDFIKSGDVLVGRCDEEGYWMMGYEDAMLKAFREKTGKDARQLPNKDPEWLKFRAAYVTDFMRRARQIQRELYPKTKIGLFAVQSAVPGADGGTCWADNLFKLMKIGQSKKAGVTVPEPLANLEDHETWFREGLLDSFCVGHNCNNNSPEVAVKQWLNKRPQIPPRIYVSMEVSSYPLTGEKWPYAKAEAWIEEIIAPLVENGVKEIIFRESAPMWLLHPDWWKTLNKVASKYV